MFRRLAKKIVLAIPDVRRVFHERDTAWGRIAQLEQALQEASSDRASSDAKQHLAEQEAHHLRAAYANFGAGKAITTDSGQSPLWEKRDVTQQFRDHFRSVMLETFYLDNPLIDISNKEIFERDLAAHTEHRYRVFEQWIATWLLPALPKTSSMTALEIGSGTGSSTLAFAQHVKKLVSFEIDLKATAAARERLSFFGLDNVDFHEGQFNSASAFAKSGESVDLVVLCAVLEHMTDSERRDTLQTAWGLLKSGGFLVVADTPNRFAVYDDHTSLLPYYSALPPSIQEQYAGNSPRTDFRNSIAETSRADMPITLARWGAGISYHDFELALGHSIHDHIVLDGYESPLISMYPDKLDDALMRIAFEKYDIPAHRAFTRNLLHFVVRKP